MKPFRAPVHRRVTEFKTWIRRNGVSLAIERIGARELASRDPPTKTLPWPERFTLAMVRTGCSPFEPGEVQSHDNVVADLALQRKAITGGRKEGDNVRVYRPAS